MKYIKLSNPQKGCLRNIFNVSQVCIWKALYYKSSSDLSEKIRTAALEMGGRVIHELDVTDGFMPNCRTEFDHENNTIRRMTMTYPNAVRVVYDAEEDSARLFIKDRIERQYWNVTLDNLYNVAFEAQELSESLNA